MERQSDIYSEFDDIGNYLDMWEIPSWNSKIDFLISDFISDINNSINDISE